MSNTKYGIPHLLLQRKIWCLWRLVERDGRKTKIPFQADGQPAKCNDPATWTDFPTAYEALKRGGFNGLGIMLGDGLVGIDLDWKGWTGAGVPQEVQAILRRFDSYAEWSPSWRGAHILLLGNLPPGVKHRKMLSQGVEIEIYDRERFFTFTGERLNDNEHDIADQQKPLVDLLRELDMLPQPQVDPTRDSTPVALDDEDLLERMFKSKHGSAIKALWTGDWSGYPSRSEADLALASHLLWWTDGDIARADRLFRRSGLYRPKWDERHSGDGRTYGELTLEKARANLHDGYEPRGIDGNEDAQDGDRPQSPARKPVSDELVRLALERSELWHDGEKKGWASIQVGDHTEHWTIRSRNFRLWLANLYYEQKGKPPHTQALQDAISVIEGRAIFEGAEYPTYLRVAHLNDEIWLDLGRPDYLAVRVTASGWEIAEPEIRFRRSEATEGLPIPEPGSAQDLQRLLDLWALPQDHRVLIIAWALGCLGPGPYPILILNGEQGSGKSTLTRGVRRLIDPGDVAKHPRSSRDLFVSAKNSWILAYDNVRVLPDWLSDDLCKLSTGGVLRVRELYTDDKEVFFRARRCVIMNGITDFATHPDLIDRSIILTLPPIARYGSEAELWARYYQLQARALGALLDLASLALRELERTPTPNVRMADFARWALAAEPGYTAPGTFVRTFSEMREASVGVALESDPIYPYLLRLLSDTPTVEGTAQEILDRLNTLRGDERPPYGWPRTPHALGAALRRIAPALRREGIYVEPIPRQRNRRGWRLEKRTPDESGTTPPPELDERDGTYHDYDPWEVWDGETE